MKTIIVTILIAIALISLTGCESDLNGVSEPIARGNKIPDITLTTDFQMYISDFREVNLTSDAVTVSFIGFTDADTTDYVSAVIIDGYTGGQWESIVILGGCDYINGYQAFGFINQWESIRITAKLWSDEVTINTNATLKLSEININE